VVTEHAGEHVQVKVAGRAAFDLHDTQVVGDSPVGTTGAGNRHVVATEDVEYVRVQETDNVKTGLLILFASAALPAPASEVATLTITRLP
jgi:hypothetical protein